MRASLLAGCLLLVLALGVVQARRSGEPEGFVAGVVEPVPPPSRTPTTPTPPARRAAETPARAPSVLSAGELSVLGAEPEIPMVRYVDADGSIHMVRGLERVPAEHRARAVVLGSGNVNVVSIPAPTTAAFRDWRPDANHSDVVLFSARWCGACQRAKRHLERRGVRYEERDIDADAGARQEVESILGRIAIPLLDVDGRYISGYRPDVYDRALGQG